MGGRLIGKKNHFWKGGQIEKKCIVCNGNFRVYPSRKDTAIFCSILCKNQHLGINKIGTKHSEESRRKMSEAQKGKIVSQEFIDKMKIINKNKKPPNRKGCKMSIEARHKISESRKGKKSPNWKGGITPVNNKIRKSFEYKLWRESVFERDDWTCVFCGERSGKGNPVVLNADHIKPFALFPELRFAIDNGRTLCIDCHRKTDTYGAKIKKIIYEN